MTGADASRIAALCALLWLCLGTAEARPLVMVTVDVESTENLPLPRQVDAVCTGGTRCGLLQITRMLARHGIAGTFFLDVYEYKAWGEPELRGIARELQSRGDDVALHTHPQWAYDPHRPFLYQYDLADQTRIVADGARRLEEWTGLPVVAHRAGAYSANSDTIQALARSGIQLDASFFPGEPRCHLAGLGLPINLPASIDGITEIPVTVYERHERPAGLGRLLPAHVALGKIDVNAMDDERQAAAALNAAVAADTPVIVVFLHSFSLIRSPEHDAAPLEANGRAVRIFETLLDGVSSRHLEVVTSRELVSQDRLAALRMTSAGIPSRSTVPQAQIEVPTLKYVARMVRSVRPAVRIAAGCTMLLAFGGAVWRVLRKRRGAARALGEGA